MSDAHKCPECRQFILTDHCFECDIDIRNNKNYFDDIFGGTFNDIFKGKNED